MKTGTAGCSREIQDADVTTGILATSVRLALELKLFSIMWEHQLQLFLPLFRFVMGPRLLNLSKELKCCPFKNRV